MTKQKIAIIGGGIIGLSVAYSLLKQDKFYVDIYEKEKKFGLHQSGNNSGVLHCGIAYKHGSLKAKLAVSGVRKMVKFCEKNNIPHKICGKLIVSSNSNANNNFLKIIKNGEKNGLRGLKILNKSEIKKIEPNVKSKTALLVPEEGIVSYPSVIDKLEYFILKYGGNVFLNSNVDSITEVNNQIIINSNHEKKSYDSIINCAGLFSDKIYNKFTKIQRDVRIVPFRGEYFRFKNEYSDIINNLVYPMPDPKYPFLGVHFTRMINGKLEVGPNAVLSFKREGYSNTDFSFRDVTDYLTYMGFYKFFFKNFKFCINQLISSYSKNAFINQAKILVPDVEDYMLERGFSGVRAQAITNYGEALMDFKIIKYMNQIHVINAPSPGATSAFSIADYIIKNYVN